jgi:site-specific recombinase XerD
MTDAILNWKRFLKRRNCAPNTVKNYLNMIKHFVVWVDVPVEEVKYATVSRYIDYLMKKRLVPKTVNCHLDGIRQFYHYLKEEEGMAIINPIRKNHMQKMSRPLPRHLRDEQVEIFFKAVRGYRDRAMFMLMLRCGLRVEEVANLAISAIRRQPQDNPS